MQLNMIRGKVDDAHETALKILKNNYPLESISQNTSRGSHWGDDWKTLLEESKMPI